MNPGRFTTIFLLDLKGHLQRVSWWVLMALMLWMAWFASTQGAHVRPVHDGARVFNNSQFNIAGFLPFLFVQFSAFWVAMAAGLSVQRDDQTLVGSILHATPLTPAEYIWAKFAAVMAAFLLVVAFQEVALALLCRLGRAGAEHHGPFLLRAFLWPALLFILPLQTFVAGTAFGVGARTRNLLVVVALPVAMFLLCFFFLCRWSPEWLDPRWNRLLMWLEPSGGRWLSETWLKVDLGTAFYNESRITYDLPFLLSRLAWTSVGLGVVAWSLKGFTREVRGAEAGSPGFRARSASAAPVRAFDGTASSASASWTSLRDMGLGMGMGMGRPGLLLGLRTVFRLEMRASARNAGLYILAPLILVDTFMRGRLVGDSFTGLPLLLTPGGLALRVSRNLGVFLCLLLLFCIVESLERERSARLDAILDACPIPARTFLAGKVLAGLALVGLVLAADFAFCLLLLGIQGTVPLAGGPFLLVWGGLLVPTLLLWVTFVALVHVLTRDRLATYGMAFGALTLTGICIHTGHMTWAGDWLLWDSVAWSDLGPLEWNRSALVHNRLAMVALAILLGALALRLHTGRRRDLAGLLGRLRPGPFLRAAGPFMAAALIPLLLLGTLAWRVSRGPEGEGRAALAREYWRRNVEVHRNDPLPVLQSLDLDLVLDPPTGAVRGRGAWRIRNSGEQALERIPFTAPIDFRHIVWTVEGRPVPVEDRAGLQVLTLRLEPGASVLLGFAYEGRLGEGITRGGGEVPYFMLPSSAVLRDSLLVPTLGFQPGLGITEANAAEAPEAPEDWYRGLTPPTHGVGNGFRTRIRITGPERYRFLSVGSRMEERVEGGQRTVLWASEAPVVWFNVQAGCWKVATAPGVAVYHDPRHPYNVPSLLQALSASRECYARWFGAIPCSELRLSEFPGLAHYAQSFPGNIAFSEDFGFLARPGADLDQAFGVAAHECAHQWWGNLVVPGRGPGDMVITEGLANFAAALLLEEVKGASQRRHFLRLIESVYLAERSADADRPLVRTASRGPAGARASAAAAYDKGAWAFWMLMDHMGREAFLEGLRDFAGAYRENPDHPALQDLLAVLRTRAADPDAFDAFAGQWFLGVELPRYQVRDARRAPRPEGTWEVTFTLANAGGTRMPVPVDLAQGRESTLQSFRTLVVLGPGERRTLTLTIPFRPDRIEPDPEVRILQLQRREALHRF